YIWPKMHIPDQTKFPENKDDPFNYYLEKYEDRKAMAERLFLQDFTKSSPFKPPQKSQFIYPNSKRLYIPTWKTDEMMDKLIGRHKFIPQLEQKTDIDDLDDTN
ncbi:MAG: 39S ribosomal protein L38, mitochondrial, partial [Paramarteilia canceri]